METKFDAYNAFTVSIRALAGRAIRHNRFDFDANGGFNPRPRREGDTIHSTQFESCNVSIRALAGRAINMLAHRLKIFVFQSAPSQGGRLICS